ncbi:MAG: hypothetical protein IJA77_04160 [Clostridia bacterium]|nr:hypothetical protein [Clostridia bacterium]
MKKSCSRIALACFLACLLLMDAVSALAADLPLMSISIGTAKSGSTLSFSWGGYSGTDHYEYSVRDTTTNELHRDHKYTTSKSGTLGSSYVEAGHSYHIWVGAYNSNNQLIAQVHGDVTAVCGDHDYNSNGVCAECGAKCSHKWSKKTGVCNICDMECPHDDTYELETEIVGLSISNTQHELTTTYDEVCWECRYTLRKDLTKTTIKKHSLDSNGDCTMCNYTKSCQHSTTKLVERSETVTSYNDEKHKIKVVSDIVCANANCGKMIEMGGDIDVYYEAHTFRSGECSKCGHSQYEVLSATISRGSSTATVGSGISASCSVSGGSGNYQYAWTAKCGSSTMDSTAYGNDSYHSFTASKVGSWTITVTVKDKVTGKTVTKTTGTITVTEPECTHETYSDVARSDKEYVKLSDANHTIKTTYDRFCSRCGAVINTYIKTATEEHTYSGGNCIHCGSAEVKPECAHSTMTSTEQSRKVRKTTSSSEHVIDITWKDICASCGITLNTTRTSTEMEKHSYDASGMCRCGYIKPAPTCDHADTEKIFVSSHIESIDADRHLVTTTYQIKCVCGLIVKQEHEEYAYFSHTYEDGKCKHCGYSQPVTPVPETPVPVTPAPATPAPATPVPENVIYECEYHHGAHQYTEVLYAAKHPHVGKLTCRCGATDPSGAQQGTGKMPTCCECGNHVWNKPFYSSTDGQYMQVCTRCVERHFVQVELDDHITTKFAAGGDYDRSDAFDEVHGFACEANQNGVYVYVNETIEAGSNFSKAVFDTFVTDKGEATEKAYVKEWEHIITNTLMDHLDANQSESIDIAALAELFGDEDLNSLSKYAKDRGEDYMEYAEKLLTQKRTDVTAGIQAYERLAEMRGLSVQETMELGELQKQQANLTKGIDDWQKASKTLKVIGISASAFVEMVENSEQQQVFEDLANYSYECEQWLSLIEAAAEKTGDTNIATAAENVRKRLEFEQECAFAGEWVSIVETGKKVGTDVLTDGINSAVEKYCPALAVISLCCDTADIALDWKDSYESSFRLMMLHDMMRSMETFHPSKGVFEDSTVDMDLWFDESMESGYIMAQLYTEVQKEGLTESVNYLEEYEDGTFLNVERDFGISYDTKMQSLNASINAAQGNHRMLKEFYADRDLWDVTAFELDYTEEELWNYDNVSKKNQMEQEDAAQYAKVINTAKLRKDADPSSDYVITKYTGDVVKVLLFKDDWFYVEYDEGRYAYIHSSRVILQ